MKAHKLKDPQVYVAGFYFSSRPAGWKVALVRKKKPDWQAGKLNAIGGKVEDDESIFEAMAREFEEEAGKRVDSWELFCSLTGVDYVVHFFRAAGSFKGIRSMEEEKIEFHWAWNVLATDDYDIIGNLNWLIPAALEGVDLGQVKDGQLVQMEDEVRNQLKEEANDGVH